MKKKADVNDKKLGSKFDAEKNRMGLLPWESLNVIGWVLTVGAKKYLPQNWKEVPNAEERYKDALFRHLSAWATGEREDKETRLPHLAHAGACLLFLLWFEERFNNHELTSAHYMARLATKTSPGS